MKQMANTKGEHFQVCTNNTLSNSVCLCFRFNQDHSQPNLIWNYKVSQLTNHLHIFHGLLEKNRVVFNWASKVNCVCFVFALLLSVVDQQTSRHSFVTCKHAFSCALRRLHVIALNSDWLIALFRSVVIGWSNCFGFGFTTLNWKLLYQDLGCLY